MCQSSLEDLQARGNIPRYELVVEELYVHMELVTYGKQNLSDVSALDSAIIDCIYSSTISAGSMAVTNCLQCIVS